MDPLSEVLSLLRPHNAVSSGFEIGGDWAVQFGAHHGQIKCYVILSGVCWLEMVGIPEPMRIGEGECFVISSGRDFRLASKLGVPAVSASTLFADAPSGEIMKVGKGGDFSLIGSRFVVGGGQSEMLQGLLSPLLHLRSQSDRSALRWAVDRMMLELREGRPGSALVAQDLAHMMLVSALRGQPVEGLRSGAGWALALTDKHLSMAITAIHEDPARRWTIRDLGAQAGLSRAAFAARFKRIVGEAPMHYLARWRMALACDRLERTGDPVSAIATALGYESESAFSTAFKRVVGRSPRAHRVGHAAFLDDQGVDPEI